MWAYPFWWKGVIPTRKVDAGPVTEEKIQGLILRIKDGDGDAFGELYDEFFDRIYAYLSWRTNRRETAEDLTSSVFIKTLEALPKYMPGKAPFSAWLFRIAHNLLLNHYRSSGRSVSVDFEVEYSQIQSKDDPVEEFFQEEDRTRVRAAIRTLTGDQQSVVVMKFIGGLSNTEIATAIGKREGSIKSLQYRALASLGRVLSKEGGSNE